MAEKTEKPTQKRLQDARKKGQVIKSAEIVTGFQMAVILSYFIVEGQGLLEAIWKMIDIAIGAINMPIKLASQMVIAAFVYILIRFIAGLAFILIVTVAFSCLVQTGPVWASESLIPSFKKINVLENAKQIFSMKSLFQLFKNMAKILVLSLVFYYLLDKHVNIFQYLPTCGAECGVTVTFTLIKWLWGAFLLCYVVFSAADYAFVHFQTMKQLKMSKDDTKQEYKQTEGNPEVKQKRRELQRETANGSLAASVKKSTVVVRNPTHIAVCLHYDPNETPLPVVLDKAKEHMALHVVDLAEKNGIPLVENIPLARALFKQVEPGQVIPESLFEPVAELLRVVMNVSYDEGGDDN
ncbi:EscU/YscU/HrcU family type III secretion system export apparatus switch protein [Vibrio ostreicida]|uniref:EscU/YscU/HrcU family type III secretion system export apparatus switch protein n=1 Tax=Vibrio ostreicida TaxID=526588 RepID=A0ABT8BUE2_9VIBR|nr:EscU/YscU/HrcU family type III secretion system export apparatus switch protein [Vibrio ostreicida]MDN3609996.1 EscU/YscU/HrcU family type III secretion system export apparatus switch protein [Vibrio ostreicida]NPD10421.1 EscU/YscU/HrcU family type III secretion system export apparatus switch protein [Vibrio ostreicida]